RTNTKRGRNGRNASINGSRKPSSGPSARYCDVSSNKVSRSSQFSMSYPRLGFMCHFPYFTLFMQLYKMRRPQGNVCSIILIIIMQERCDFMQREGLSAGLKAGLTIAIGYFPVALTFGLLAKTTGLSLIETVA